MSKSIRLKSNIKLESGSIVHKSLTSSGNPYYWNLSDICNRLFGFVGKNPNKNIDECRTKCGFFRFFTSETTGTLPTGITGNQLLVFVMTDNANYNVQIAMGFGIDKLAMRRCEGSTTWTAWKYITFA